MTTSRRRFLPADANRRLPLLPQHIRNALVAPRKFLPHGGECLRHRVAQVQQGRGTLPGRQFADLFPESLDKQRSVPPA